MVKKDNHKPKRTTCKLKWAFHKLKAAARAKEISLCPILTHIDP
jgi:hypothetical protein